MRIYSDESLRNFRFWSGAVCRAEQLTDEQLDAIERELEMIYPDGMSDTELNDLFWFEFEWVVGLIGLALNDSGDICDPSELEEEEDFDEEDDDE
jgi:hypothetical protein